MKNRFHRHPLQATSDRLGDHLDKHFDKTDGQLRDAIAKVRDWLERTAEKDPNR